MRSYYNSAYSDNRFKNMFRFNWLRKPTLSERNYPYEDTEDQVVDSVKDIVHTFAKETVGITQKTTEIPFTSQSLSDNFTENAITELVTEQTPLLEVVTNLSAMESQNATLFAEETTTFNILNTQNSSIFEETTTFNLFNNQNSSIMEETTTFSVFNGQNSSIIEETTTNFIEETSNTFTEAFNVSQETITNILTPTEDYEELHFHHEGSPVLLLAILGVILALLVVIVISLIFVYNRYKQDNGIRSRSGEYCVQQMSLSDTICTKKPTMEFLQEKL